MPSNILQTIFNKLRRISSRYFNKVTFATKFALNWSAAPLCSGSSRSGMSSAMNGSGVVLSMEFHQPWKLE